MGDNQFSNCPARMEDGRLYSTYHSSQVTLDLIKKANRIDLCAYDNNDMRLFLQHNAQKLMNQERSFLALHNSCNLPKKQIIIMPPYAR
jgi:hypothetical protein